MHLLAAGAWITGAVWLIFRYFVRQIDAFGFENPHPAQRWWLIAHALVSFGALWMYGVLWPEHIVRSWKAKARRLTGGTLWGITLWLALTGCLLYYIGHDATRAWMSLAHWVVGLAAVGAYLWHRPWLPRRNAERSATTDDSFRSTNGIRRLKWRARRDSNS